MTTRFVTRTASGSMTVMLIVGLSAVLSAEQKPAPKAAPPVQKTAWGDPDLQGTWSGDSAFAIPTQRPEALGTKAELTDQEYRVLPYDCHEGNLAVLQGLGGERAEDAAIVRARRPIQGALTVGGQPIPEGGPAQN